MAEFERVLTVLQDCQAELEGYFVRYLTDWDFGDVERTAGPQLWLDGSHTLWLKYFFQAESAADGFNSVYFELGLNTRNGEYAVTAEAVVQATGEEHMLYQVKEPALSFDQALDRLRRLTSHLCTMTELPARVGGARR